MTGGVDNSLLPVMECGRLSDDIYHYFDDIVKKFDSYDQIPGYIEHYNHVGSGEKIPAAKKHWTKYKTWEELANDPGAKHEYNVQRSEVRDKLNIDWSEVIQVLRTRLDKREWAGLINVHGGVAYVEHLIPSPYSIGETPGADNNVYALVPADIVEFLVNKPAMFMFHTHPSDNLSTHMPSTQDIISSIPAELLGWGAGALVISANNISLQMNTDHIPNLLRTADGHFSLHGYRKLCLDIVMATVAKRSVTFLHDVDSFQRLYLGYGVRLIDYPQNSTFAYTRYNTLYQRCTTTPFKKLRELLDDLEAKEK